MIKAPYAIRSLELIRNWIAKGCNFPSKITPLVADSPTNLMSDPIVDVCVPINRCIFSEDLETAIVISDKLVSCSIAESIPSTQTVIGLFNSPANPMTMEHVGTCRAYSHN